MVEVQVNNYGYRASMGTTIPSKIETYSRPRKTNEPDYKRFGETDFNLRHEKVIDRVKSILMFDKFARKNDLWLYMIYLSKLGYIDLKIDIKQFKNVNPPESVSRARRQLYSEIKEGKHPELKFLIDSDTEQIRKEYQNNYHDYYQDKLNSKIAENVK